MMNLANSLSRRVALGAMLSCFCSALTAQIAPKPSPIEVKKLHTATGTFDVKMSPLDAGLDGGDKASDSSLGRMKLEKQFHGDLEASGIGQMLTGMTSTKGSAGYVAIERVTGTLKGRKGSFIFQHSGIMSAAGQQLTITVIPDSGSDELKGLSGTFKIRIEPGGKHFYDFQYELPESAH